MMPSARRIRWAVLLAALVLLSVVYVSTGASATTQSDFYQKTVSLMDAKARAADLANLLTTQQDVQQHKVDEQSDTLRSRLKEAENEAKKNADNKYRALQDVERAIKQNRGPQGGDEKSVAGRKMMAKEPSEDGSVGTDATAGQQTLLHPPNDATDAPAPRAAEEDLANILKRAPMVIFSKSYCPYSKKAKRVLLQAYTIEPAPYVIELDQHPKGSRLQELLQEKTGRRTVPNILINGKSIGGGDEIERLWKSGELPVTIRQMGAKKIEKVVENFGWVGDGGEQRPAFRRRSR